MTKKVEILHAINIVEQRRRDTIRENRPLDTFAHSRGKILVGLNREITRIISGNHRMAIVSEKTYGGIPVPSPTVRLSGGEHTKSKSCHGSMALIGVLVALLVSGAVTAAVILAATPRIKTPPSIPGTFDVVDVTATYEWTEKTLDDGTTVSFTSNSLVQLSRPPREDVGYTLPVYIKNLGPGAIAIKDFVWKHVAPKFSSAGLASFVVSDADLAAGETAQITLLIYVDAIFYDANEDVYKLNEHHQADVLDSNNVLNHLGMNVKFRA